MLDLYSQSYWQLPHINFQSNPELRIIDMHGVSPRHFSGVTGTSLYLRARLESKHSEHC